MIDTVLEQGLILVAQCETQSNLERVLSLKDQVLAGIVQRLLVSFPHRCNRLILRERAIDRVRRFKINLVMVRKILKVATSLLFKLHL